MTDLKNLVSANLAIVSHEGRTISEAKPTKESINRWKGALDMDQIHQDVGLILARTDLHGGAILRLNTAVRNEDGDIVGEELAETVLYTIGQDGKLKWKTIGVFTTAEEQGDEDGAEIDTSAVFTIQYTRVLPDGTNTLRREAMGQPFFRSGDLAPEAVIEEARKYVADKMKTARKAINIEFEVRYSDFTIAKGSANGDEEITPFDQNEADRLAAELLEVTTSRHRRDVMELMNGRAVSEYVTDSMTGLRVNPTTIRGFAQEGIYAKVKTLVIAHVKNYVQGKHINDERKLISRTAYEPSEALGDFDKEFISVFISKSVMGSLESAEDYVELLNWLSGEMAKSEYKFFIVGRKKRLIFGRQPFGATQITRDFMRVNVNRAEHLGQLISARGIRATGEIELPEVFDLKVPDGVVMALNLRQGAKLGLTEGVWQIRSINPYSKGTIVVSDAIKVPFLNEDAIKVKPEKVNGVTQWPKTIKGSDIIAISNSDTAFNMKFSHQLGYVFIERFLEAKGKIKPWGKIPELMALNVTEKKVKATLPTEWSRLQSIGLPYEHFKRPEGLEAVLVRAMRPEFCKLTMFVALPLQHLDRNWFTEPGMYMPITTDVEEEGRYWVRIPALAVNGAVQDLHYKDAHGNKILADKPSPMANVTVAAIYEPKVLGKDKDDNEILQFEDDVELGGAGRSRIIWNMMAALGADSDGDRTGRTFKSIDRFLENAGLKTTFDVPLLKTKNPYPGIDTWSDEHRAKLWAESTPLLGNVGIGDVMTQDCADLVFEGHMKWEVWQKQAIAGAEIVQSGVSAPKYFMERIYKPLLSNLQVSKLLKDKNVGRGYKGEGLLYQPTLDAIEKELVKFFPPEAEYRSIPVTHTARKWEGGFTSFLRRLDVFDEQMGDYWVTYVQESFKHELLRMQTGHITNPDERRAAVQKFTKNFKEGHARKMIRGYISAFIQAHPDKPHIWAWLLSTEFVRPQPGDRRPDGMPLTAPEMEEGMGRILEVMGMPYDLERLEKREEAFIKAEEARKERKANR